MSCLMSLNLSDLTLEKREVNSLLVLIESVLGRHTPKQAKSCMDEDIASTRLIIAYLYEKESYYQTS